MKLTNNLFFYPEKGMLDCNTYVIRDDISIVIDPGCAQFFPELIRDLYKDGINIEDIDIITNTHLHIDHYWANESLKGISEAKILSHPLQKKFYDMTVIRTSQFFGLPEIEFKEDGYLDNGKLSSGDLEFDLIHSSGHSPDSICYYCKKERVLICGDVIFYENTGRIDLPGGNAEQLKHSIEKLSQMEIKYLLPGHMDIITNVKEVERNFDFIKTQIFQWL